MIRTTDGNRCHELESIVATDSGIYSNRKLYVIDGRHGLYRRVPAGYEGDGIEVETAWFQGGIIYLVVAEMIEDELTEAGIIEATLAPGDVIREDVSSDAVGA